MLSFFLYNAANAQSTSVSSKNIFGIDSSKISAYHFGAVDEQLSLDTAVTNFHLFHPAQSEKYPFYFDLGNVGQPVYQFYNFTTPKFGFNAAVTAIQPMCFHFDEMLLLRTYHHAYTDLKYVIGSNSEGVLDVVHSQNITRNFHIDAKYRNVTSDGIYQQQKTKNQNFFLNTQFQSNNERWISQASIILNRFSFLQNGGVTIDSVYESNYINKSVVPVVLQAATSKIKQDGFQFANSYDFGTHYTKKIDDTTTLKHYVPFFRIQHTFLFENQTRHSANKEFDSINYLPLHIYSKPIDTLGTKDSLVGNLVIKTISNRFNFLTMPFKNIFNDSIVLRKTMYDAGLEQQFISIKNTQTVLTDFNLNINAKIYSNKLLPNAINYLASVQYCLAGFNQTDYKISAQISYRFFENYIVGIKAISQQYKAFQQNILLGFGNFNSNYSNGSSTQFQNFESWVGIPKYHFSVSFSQNIFNNFQYFNSNAEAEISGRTITQPYVQVKKDFQIAHWHFNNLLNYNLFNNSEIPMPAVFYRTSLFYENGLFKKNLFLQAGLQLNFQDKYFAPQWMPTLDYFYNQHQNLYGSQQNLQVFVNVKVKRARLFVKMDNLLQGIDGHGFYNGKFYPIPDRAIKFGISWRFFDE